MRWGTEFATWDALLRTGRDRSRLVEPGSAYAVDPAGGLDAIASLLAVATVPDTVLVWASGMKGRELLPGLSAVECPVREDRPLWAVATSGSSGVPKLAVGHADSWELVALHYEQAMFPGGLPPVLATCLPLQFSAAFFMTLLPSLLLRRDLVVFPAQDWEPVVAAAARDEVFVLGVPALAAAACLGMTAPVDMRRARLFLGGGHLSATRVDLIRSRFAGAEVANLYGTAETGAIAVDHDPGHNRHVGPPIPGKAVWLADADEHGVGAVAVAGPDCCRYVWRPGEGVTPNPGYVTGTDYARFDADGNLCLEGRVDGGEKLRGVLVYPRAIERHLLALDGVADVRVLVQRPDNGLEHLVAKVVGRVGEAEVRAHCAALPEPERPTRVECVPESAALAAYSANGKL
ncbi:MULTISPECIES: AMP-binding protein [Actinokineospora]|uniref:AMP-binding protein n=1 Tax=Actinokineospora TaxID=39845 RepID=UPI00166FFE40|nr:MULTISPECIES: AMP-binding protein [Actinokineospora]